MRNLQDALTRAENLRDFAKTNQAAFEKSVDWQDIVLLADEIERLRSQGFLADIYKNADVQEKQWTIAKDDHDESW